MPPRDPNAKNLIGAEAQAAARSRKSATPKRAGGGLGSKL